MTAHKGVELILHKGELINQDSFSNFPKDAVKIKGDGCAVVGCEFAHSTMEGPHGDAIQLEKLIEGKDNQQYCLAMMSNTLIRGNTILAPDTDLQGLFSSDGLHRDLVIEDNTIIAGYHGISINGALSATLDNNDAVARFWPARIGGGIYDQKLWVLHFSDEGMEYEEIITDQYIEDYRYEIFNTTDRFLINFRWQEYRDFMLKIPNAGGNRTAAIAYNVGLLFGEEVFRGSY